jgi:hypothetical protein
MTRIATCLAICSLLCAAPAATGQTRAGRPAARKAAAPPAPLDLSGDLSRLFPTNTFLYVEAADLASAVDQMGGVETLHRLLARAVEQSSRVEGKAEKLPLTAPELRTLLTSSLAVGMFAAPAGAADPGSPHFAAVLRLPSSEAAAELTRRVAELAARDGNPTRKPRAERLAGHPVTTVPGATPGESTSYTVVGNHILFGQREGLAAVFATASAPQAKTLADEPGYAAVAQRAAGGNHLTVFLNGRPLAEFVSNALSGPATTVKGVSSKKDPKLEALKAFLGLDALLSFGSTLQVSGGVARARFDMGVDRSRPGLVNTLTDPPAITVRSAAFLPADADFVEAFSVDLVALFDLAVQSMPPDVTKGTGIPPVNDMLQSFEAMTGMRLRDDFLAAFGNEMALSFDTDGLLSSLEGPPASGPKLEDWHMVGLIEVRNPDVLRKAMAWVAATAAKGAFKPGEHNGVEIWEMEEFALAFQDGFAVLGTPADVRRCLDAHRTGETLASTPQFAAAMGQPPGGTIAAVYTSAAYFKSFLTAAKLPPEAVEEFHRAVENGFAMAVTKDDSGVHSDYELPVANILPVYDGWLDSFYKTYSETRRKENEVAVVEEIRAINSAQETFKDQTGRYGMLRELAAKGLVDSRWSSKTESVYMGYRFAMAVTSAEGRPNARYALVAVPIFYGESGRRSFFTDETQVVRGADKRGAPATVDDRSLDEEGGLIARAE